MAENENFEAQKAKVIKTLNTMFDYLGLTATLRVEDKGAKIAVKLTSDDAGRIIGRKGQTLESLQLILNRIMFKEDENCPHVMLDIDGYARGERAERFDAEGEESGERRPPRERRERYGGRREESSHATAEQLEQQALDAAKEVKRWGEPMMLPAMNARDRRIIHVTLQNDPEIETASEGEGAFKKVVISLKKD